MGYLNDAIALERYGMQAAIIYEMPTESMAWRKATRTWANIFMKLDIKKGLMSKEEAPPETPPNF